MNTIQSKNNTKAHITGVLLILTTLISYLYFPLMVLIKPFDSIEQFYLWGYCIVPIGTFLLALLSYALLLGTKPNKPTRIALYLLMVYWLVSTMTQMYVFLDYVYEIPTWFGYISLLDRLLCVCSVYIYGLIYRNNDMDKRDISWINIYIIGNLIGVLFSIDFALKWAVGNYSEIIQAHLGKTVFWNSTGSYNIFSYCFMVLMLIAHWRFAHCAAFTGTDEQRTPAEENYKPIARYVVAALVALTLGGGIFFLLYHYAEPLLNAIG